MLIVHHHPHLMDVPGQEDKPHLGHPHDHYLTVSAFMLCQHLERDKDLLLLHHALETAVEFPKRVDMGEKSFEQICVAIRARINAAAPSAVIFAIKVAAYDEGAEVLWDVSKPNTVLDMGALGEVPSFLRKRP